MTLEKPKTKPHFSGHRQRLKDRFRKSGVEALADYELLELLLYSAIPRKDVKPLAKDLIAHFGSFAEVISAPAERLTEMTGISENVVTALKLVEAGAQKLAQGKILDKPVLSNWHALIDYCHIQIGHRKNEQFRILFLDQKKPPYCR